MPSLCWRALLLQWQWSCMPYKHTRTNIRTTTWRAPQPQPPPPPPMMVAPPSPLRTPPIHRHPNRLKWPRTKDDRGIATHLNARSYQTPPSYGAFFNGAPSTPPFMVSSSAHAPSPIATLTKKYTIQRLKIPHFIAHNGMHGWQIHDGHGAHSHKPMERGMRYGAPYARVRGQEAYGHDTANGHNVLLINPHGLLIPSWTPRHGAILP